MKACLLRLNLKKLAHWSVLILISLELMTIKNGIDSTLETTDQELKDAVHLSYTTNLEDVKDCSIFIVTVPTPIDKHKRPDLTPLEKASESIGSILKNGDIVIYESTFYPGANDVDELYQEIIAAGAHKASSIKVAKVIENTQRDIKIVLFNELVLIFNKLNIDTESVLEAAGTKWNFCHSDQTW